MAPRCHPGPLRHPHGARRAATGVGPQRRSGRFAEPARIPAFDFNWQGPLSDEQRDEIEDVTNEAVEADYPVNTMYTKLEKAKAMGAMALFGETYPEEVRLVEIGGPFSIELCGGRTCTTRRRSGRHHARRVVGRFGRASRRGYVGLDSFRYLAKERALLAGLASSLKVPSEEVPTRVATLVDRLKVAEKEIDRIGWPTQRLPRRMRPRVRSVGKVRVVAQRMPVGTRRPTA